MARIIHIHTLVQGREKMWRFVRILCIWNQYANMLFMLRGIPSARNKEKGKIILYYGEIIFWLYYYGCGYFMKRRWINNCLTNQKGRRKQNGFFREYFSCHNKGLCNRAEGGREGSDKKGRLSLTVGERWKLSMAAERRVSSISSHRQHHQREKRPSGVLGFCREDDKEPHDVAACPLSTAGVPGHGQKRGRTRGLLQGNLQCWDWILKPGPHLGWDGGQGGCILSLLHVKPRGPGLVRTQRVMTLGAVRKLFSGRKL